MADYLDPLILRIQSSTLQSNPFKDEEEQTRVKLADEVVVAVNPHRAVQPAVQLSRENAGIVGSKVTSREIVTANNLTKRRNKANNHFKRARVHKRIHQQLAKAEVVEDAEGEVEAMARSKPSVEWKK